MLQSDQLLVQAAQSGDPDALAEIYNRHYASIYAYIYYRVGDQRVAEDLSSDVFVRMVDRIHSFQSGERPILAWLFTIAHNLVVDYYRRNPAARSLPMEEQLPTQTEDGPERLAGQHLSRALLLQAMNDLTEAQRQVVFLRFFEGRNQVEVAQILHKEVADIKSLQARALAALRRILVRQEVQP